MDSLFSSNYTNSTANSTQLIPTTNPSYSGTPQSSFLKWLHLLSYSIICAAGILGNLVVILACRKPGMKTVSNVLIANLGVADIAVSLVNVPTVATYGYLVYWPFGAFLCKLISFLQGLTLAASVVTLVTIAGERYWHIVLYTRRKMTVREAFKAIAVIWATSVFIPLPLPVFSKTKPWKLGDKDVSVCIEEWPNVKSRQVFTTLVFLLLYFLPLLFISCLYVKVSLFLRSLPATQRVTHRAQKKAIRMLLTVTLLFALCWLPYHLVYLYLDLSQQQLTPALTSFLLFAQWLMFANSACNPLVYAALNDNYRREFAAMMCRRQVRQPRRKTNVFIHVQTGQNDE